MRRESVLTAQFASTLAAFPPEWLGKTMRRLLSSPTLGEAYRVVGYEIEPNVLEPDVLLLGDRSLLMIEAKTAMRGRDSHKLPLKQILHYALLPILRRESHAINLPENFLLLLLLPGDWRGWLIHAQRWAQVDDVTGLVTVDPDACISVADRKQRWAPEEISAAIASMPIFCRTWEQLGLAFQAILTRQEGDPYHAHWSRLVAEIVALCARAMKTQA